MEMHYLKKKNQSSSTTADKMTNLVPSNIFLTVTRVPGKENKKIKFDRNDKEEKRRNFFPVSISMCLKKFEGNSIIDHLYISYLTP